MFVKEKAIFGVTLHRKVFWRVKIGLEQVKKTEKYVDETLSICYHTLCQELGYTEFFVSQALPKI